MIESNFNKELEHKIDLYVNGKLSSEEIDELWAELIQDEYYLDYTKSVANLKSVIEQRREKKSTSKIYVLRQYSKYAAVAAVLVVAGVLGIMNTTQSQNGLEPVSRIGLDIVRSADGMSDATENESVKRALRLAADGNYNDAISILQSALASTDNEKQKAEIALSLGSIQYNNDLYNEAIDSFQVITNEISNADKLLLEEAYYYLGNAYLQLDEISSAKSAFESALALDGAFSRVAQTYLDALDSAISAK